MHKSNSLLVVCHPTTGPNSKASSEAYSTLLILFNYGPRADQIGVDRLEAPGAPSLEDVTSLAVDVGSACAIGEMDPFNVILKISDV